LEKIRKPSILILSTSKGVMSSREAIKVRLGGEVIVEVL
jgi:ribosomal protein S8